MKYNQLQSFEKHLAAAAPDHLCPLYFIIDKEDFLRRSAFDKISTYFFKNCVIGASSIRTFESERFSLSDLMCELNAGSLFATKRIVHITAAENLDKGIMQRLEAYFERPNSNVCLVVSASAINHNTHFYKKGEKVGVVFEPAEEKPWEKERSIHSWISDFLASEGKKIGQDASQQLVKLLGTHPAMLQSELQKLICLIGSRLEIQLEDIAAITSTLSVETGWQLGDAIFRRDVSAALHISKALLIDAVPFILLLRQLRAQFQTGLHISGLLARGGTPADIVKQFPHLRGNILDRQIRTAQEYGLKRYKNGLLKIDEAELQSKNSNVEPELLAELIIIKLTE